MRLAMNYSMIEHTVSSPSLLYQDGIPIIEDVITHTLSSVKPPDVMLATAAK